MLFHYTPSQSQHAVLHRYLDNIGRIYDFFAPAKENYITAGLLRNEHTQECLYHEGNPVGDKILAVMRNCKGPPVSDEGPEALHWFLTRTPYAGQLRHEATYGSRCLLAYEIKNMARLELVRCYDHETPRGALRWKYVGFLSSFSMLGKYAVENGHCLPLSPLHAICFFDILMD